MKRTALILALAMFLLTACNKAEEVKTLYEGDALKVERQGAITRIYDIAGGGEYTFTTHRTRTKKNEAQPVKEASTSTSTETIDIKTVHGLIIVTTKDGETLYIK